MRGRWLKVTNRVRDCGRVKTWTEYKCDKCGHIIGIATMTKCPLCGQKMIPRPTDGGIDVLKVVQSNGTNNE